MIGKPSQISLASFLVGAVYLAVPVSSFAVSPTGLAGAIAGVVTDPLGVPQMGANVMLFNRQDRLTEKALTDERGMFSFSGLVPDVYSLKVTLSTFVPAIRSQIRVLPGVKNYLNVNLANLFSSIQLVYPPAGERVLMSDDWKWVLRTSSSTRPVLRFAPSIQDPSESHHAVLFSDTRGLLRLTGGDGSSFGDGSDLGTSFALATSLLGNNLLQVSGKVGYGSASGVPSAAFRTSFSHDIGPGSPEVSVTMRQLVLPGRVGAGMIGNEGNLPALRSMSVSYDDHTQLSDTVSLQYGFSLDSVTFLDRLNYFSPYARLSWSLGDTGEVVVAYTSGNARPDLAPSPVGAESDLQRSVNSLTLFPRVSLRDARARVQRGENYEISYTRKVGSRTFSVSGYREAVTNAALTIAAPAGLYDEGDILPDVFSASSIFNAGDYESLGYTAGVTQQLGEYLSSTLIYGSIGALTAERTQLETENPDELRALIHAGRRHAVTARMDAHVPWTGTHLIASYQWTDHRLVMPGHLYSTQTLRPEPGFNLFIRQTIPTMSVLPWRMEATADLRNMLAQGYLPLSLVGGRRLLLMQTPRSFRGGLSFIF